MQECWNGRQSRLRCVWQPPCGFESHLLHQEAGCPFGVSGFLIEGGLERSNATPRWGVAGEGWTEPNLYFRQRRKCKRVPSLAPDCIWRQCVTNSFANPTFLLGNDGSDMDCSPAPRSRMPFWGIRFLDRRGLERSNATPRWRLSPPGLPYLFHIRTIHTCKLLIVHIIALVNI